MNALNNFLKLSTKVGCIGIATGSGYGVYETVKSFANQNINEYSSVGTYTLDVTATTITNSAIGGICGWMCGFVWPVSLCALAVYGVKSLKN